MINIPKGTKDILPDESYKWQYIEEIFRKTAGRYNLKEIRTPVFEHTELFERGVGETTDIVNKEMYTFLDKGGRSITLKPEGTAGVVRAFIESLSGSAMPVKMYYIIPAFRYERPQAGRLRQFHQLGVEIFGANGAESDAEAIMFAQDFLNLVGIKSLDLHINSIGSGECRKRHSEVLKQYLNDNAMSLCPVCRDRINKNPLRALDCKEESCKDVMNNAPKTLDFLDSENKEHFEHLKRILDFNNIQYNINPRLVRGLDYYTKTVFEFIPSVKTSAQETVCGGGRYDNLIESLGGKSMPAVGFAIGIERLLIALENSGVKIEDKNILDVFVAVTSEVPAEVAIKLTRKLRSADISADYDQLFRSLKAQFKYADKQNARFCITVGGNELESGIFSIKDMKSGDVISAEQDKIVEIIKEQKTK